MTSVIPLARVAEDLFAYQPTPPSGSRYDAGWGVLRHSGRHGRDYCTVSRLRLTPEQVPGAVEQARRWFADRGEPECQWWLGPSTTPSDLPLGLAAEGLVPDPHEFVSAAMLLDRAPAVDRDLSGVDVREVSSACDLQAVFTIETAVWPTPPDEIAAMTRDVEPRWTELRDDPTTTCYLASVDEVPAAFGYLKLLPVGAGALLGGSTLQSARGRGLYRALVRRRWDVAVSSGAAGLVVQASTMSRPALEKLGFAAAADLQVWAEVTDARAATK